MIWYSSRHSTRTGEKEAKDELVEFDENAKYKESEDDVGGTSQTEDETEAESDLASLTKKKSKAIGVDKKEEAISEANTKNEEEELTKEFASWQTEKKFDDKAIQYFKGFLIMKK